MHLPHLSCTAQHRTAPHRHPCPVFLPAAGWCFLAERRTVLGISKLHGTRDQPQTKAGRQNRHRSHTQREREGARERRAHSWFAPCPCCCRCCCRMSERLTTGGASANTTTTTAGCRCTCFPHTRNTTEHLRGHRFAALLPPLPPFHTATRTRGRPSRFSLPPPPHSQSTHNCT